MLSSNGLSCTFATRVEPLKNLESLLLTLAPTNCTHLTTGIDKTGTALAKMVAALAKLGLISFSTDLSRRIGEISDLLFKVQEIS